MRVLKLFPNHRQKHPRQSCFNKRESTEMNHQCTLYENGMSMMFSDGVPYEATIVYTPYGKSKFIMKYLHVKLL